MGAMIHLKIYSFLRNFNFRKFYQSVVPLTFSSFLHYCCLCVSLSVCMSVHYTYIILFQLFAAADATLSETYNFPSIEPMSPVADNNETVSPLSLPSRMSSTEVPYYVHKGETGYGIVLQSVRVYIDKTSDKYRLHHILQVSKNVLCIEALKLVIKFSS